MKQLLFIVIAVLYSFNVYTQNKAVYVIFTAYSSNEKQEGVYKLTMPLKNNEVYPNILFRLTSIKHDYAYTFVKHDQDSNIVQPQCFIKTIKRHLIDWDVVGPKMTDNEVSFLKDNKWYYMDDIYFIDRNDFYMEGNVPMMRIHKVRDLNPPDRFTSKRSTRMRRCKE